MNSLKRFDNETDTLFKNRYLKECKRINHFMMWLMAAQWIAGILFALFYSPLTWIGQSYEPHVHVWAAVLLGGSISGVAIVWTRRFPNAAHSRHVIAICQVLWSALLIHLSGGRIETHFHVFASLAILSIYRDWRILVTATVVVAIDHFVRGVFYPLSAFGIVTESPYRWIEHAAWVSFEVSFLAPACMRLRNELRELCFRQTQIEGAKLSVDREVYERTEELLAANQLLAIKTHEAEKLALVARYTENAVMITDSQSRIEWVNEGFKRLSGYSIEEIIGKRPSEFQHGPKTDAKTIEVMQTAFVNKTGFDVEVCYYNKSGKPIWLAIESQPIQNEQGQVSRFIAIQSDITERRAMQTSLAAAEQHLRSLVNNVPGALFRCGVDEGLTMLFMSKSIADISGYAPEAFVLNQKITHSDIVYSADYEAVQQAIDCAITNRSSYEIEYRLVTSEQKLKWVWERGQCYTDDNNDSVLDGMIFDIDERKLAEEELASKGSVIEESLNEIFIFDANSYRFTYVNRAGRENIGYSLDELKQLTPVDLKPEFDLDCFQELVEPLCNGDQKQLVFQTTHQRKDESQYTAEIRLQRSRYQDEDVFLAMILDVTNRVATEKKNNKLQMELIDASRKAGMAEVATGVLHNVGNILNSVNVSAAVIRRRLEKSAFANLKRVSGLITEHESSFAEFVRDDNRGQKLPVYIHKVTETLGTERQEIDHEFRGLVKNIEHIKEIISVQQAMAKTSGMTQEISPKGIIDDVLLATQSALKGHRINLIKHVAPDVPSFWSDKHKILQILVNLISNAKDALIEHHVPSPTIEVYVETFEGQVTFRITDNGIGIPPDKIEKVFQHGFTTKESGHGFGLHTSANAAGEMGGTLNVSSSGDGQGAVFELTLPIECPNRKTPTANPHALPTREMVRS